MRLIWRCFVVVCYVAGVILGGGVVGGLFWLYTSLPLIEGRLETEGGPREPVEILRDKHSVPHIFAASQEDAYFALGFVHAQDRLWQMEMTRRMGAGRLAEVAGRHAVASDRLMRTLGLRRLVEIQYAALGEETRRALQAYAAGVNAFLSSVSGAFPPEFGLARFDPEPWRPTDSLLWAKLMALRLGGNWRDELLRARMSERVSPELIEQLWPSGLEAGAAAISPRMAQGLSALASAVPDLSGIPEGASNVWAVDGRRTETGMPILANDPHLGFEAPVLWYLARIVTPERDMAGATVAGVPFLILGHNGRVAWGMTTARGDVADLFLETVDPADPGRYLTPEGPRPFVVRTEIIKVRGAEDVVISVRETRHGPVINDVVDPSPLPPGAVLSLAATFLREDDRTPEAVHAMNMAADARALLASLDDFHAPPQNIAFADVAGVIGLVTAGRFPVRNGGRGRLPAAGASGAGDWTGWVPFADLPRVLGPTSGRIVNANDQVVADGNGHYLGADWEEPYRARRIGQLIDAEPGLSVEAVGRMQMDARSLVAEAVLEPMIEILGPAPQDIEAAVGMLRAWDRTMARDRPEPLIFAAWLREAFRAVFADEIGEAFEDFARPRAKLLLAALDNHVHWCDDVRTAAREDCREVLEASLRRALADLESRLGREPAAWRWGELHQARFRHPMLDGIPILGRYAELAIATDGGDDTVNRGAMRAGGTDTPFAHVHGAGFRAVYDLAELGRSRFIIATGQSGNPMSPYYGDLLKEWRDGGAVAMRGTRSELNRTARGVLRLLPAAGRG